MKNIGYRILQFPLTRIIVGIVVVVGIVVAGQLLLNTALASVGIDRDIKNLIYALVTAVLSISSYCILFKFYEKRRISELATGNLLRQIGLGAGLGFVLQSLTILVMYLGHSFAIVSANPVLYLLPPLTMAISSAIFEEILMRGIIFRITEEKLGSALALVISALIFGALHLGNPNSSLPVALGLAIQAGLLLAAAYIYTRNLWFPIAIHFAWNFTQSGIYGARVSGNTVSKTWINSEITGPEWLSGGEFGPEGSTQATAFCLIAAIVLLVLSRRQNKLIAPFWRKAKA